MKSKLFNNPVVVVVLGLAVCLVPGLIVHQALVQIVHAFSSSDKTSDLISCAGFGVVSVSCYLIFFGRFEKRKVTELSRSKLLPGLIYGVLVGGGIQILATGVMWAAGDFRVDKINPVLPVGWYLLNMLCTAIIAEILLIGVIYRLMEQQLGTMLSLVLLTVAFAVIHARVPGAGLLGVLGVAAHAGALLGSSFSCTRNLWFPIGIHFAWDFFQAAFFGAGVMGYTLPDAFFSASIQGPEFLTGGVVGPQGSVQSLMLCLITASLFIWQCRKQGLMLRPFWAATGSKN